MKIAVSYPSKKLNKTLQTSYRNIGKALAHGIPSAIANAVLNCPQLRTRIIEKVLRTVSKEVTSLCSTSNPSLLRKSGKADLVELDLELVCKEWRERAPIFYSFLLTSATNKSKRGCTWFGSVAVAGSVLLKQRNEKMNALSTILGVLLKSKSIEV